MPNREIFLAMFWLEPCYQNSEFCNSDEALELANSYLLLIIIHPENLFYFLKK